MKDRTTHVKKLLDEACDIAGTRNKLTGYLDISTQQFSKFQKTGEVSLPCAVKLEALTGVSWKEYAPKTANKIALNAKAFRD